MDLNSQFFAHIVFSMFFEKALKVKSFAHTVFSMLWEKAVEVKCFAHIVFSMHVEQFVFLDCTKSMIMAETSLKSWPDLLNILIRIKGARIRSTAPRSESTLRAYLAHIKREIGRTVPARSTLHCFLLLVLFSLLWSVL